MLTGHKKLDLIMKRSDGDLNIAVALAAIRTIIFAHKTVDRHRFSGLVVLRIKALSVRSWSTKKCVIQEIRLFTYMR
jgi:hypothetical protein